MDRKISSNTNLPINGIRFYSVLFCSIFCLILLSSITVSTVSTPDQSNASYEDNFIFQYTSAQKREESDSGLQDKQDITNDTVNEGSVENLDNPDDTYNKESKVSEETTEQEPRVPIEEEPRVPSETTITDDTSNNPTSVTDPENKLNDLIDCVTPYCEIIPPENIPENITLRPENITLRPISACSPLPASPGIFASSNYNFLTQWGSHGTGDGQFNAATGIANINSSHVIVVDYNNYRVQKFSNDGIFDTKSGQSVSGQDFVPRSVAVDGCNILVLSNRDEPNLVFKFNMNLSPITQWGDKYYPQFVNYPLYPKPSPIAVYHSFAEPSGIAVERSSGDVYIADYDLFRIVKFTQAGGFILAWGQYGSGDGQFKDPVDVAVDSSGDVYVSDKTNHHIQKFTKDGIFLDKWGSEGKGDGQFKNPNGIATDIANNVYVADTYNKRIQKFSSNGTLITTIPVSGYVRDISIDESTGKVYAIVGHHVEVYAPNLVLHKVPIVPKIPGPLN